MSDQRIYVAQDTIEAAGEGTWMASKGSKMGFQVVMDFYTQMAIEGRCFHVRAGTITTPLTGDIAVTDTAAEMCVDAQTGYTVIPTRLNISVESINGGTLPEAYAKSVAAISTAGTAFIPLPILTGGAAASTTARVTAAGGVTVTAELATTTRQHFANTITAQADRILANETLRGIVLPGPACFYVQVAGTTAGPTYFGNLDYIELPTTAVS